MKIVKQTLERMRSAIEDQAIKVIDWDLVLPVVELMINIKINDVTATSPFELFFGRPFVGFSNHQSSQQSLLTEEQLKKRWDNIIKLIYPSVQLKRRQAQEVHKEQLQKSGSVQMDGLPPGSVVMVQVDNPSFKKKLFDGAYDGPCVVERRNRAGNYVLRDRLTGNLMPSKPLSKLKLLDAIWPVHIVATRRNSLTREIEYQIIFTDNSTLWCVSESEILDNLKEGVVPGHQPSLPKGHQPGSSKDQPLVNTKYGHQPIKTPFLDGHQPERTGHQLEEQEEITIDLSE